MLVVAVYFAGSAYDDWKERRYGEVSPVWQGRYRSQVAWGRATEKGRTSLFPEANRAKVALY